MTHLEGSTVTILERFTKFKTAKGREVTALGVLFDFTGNDKGTTVQKVENMVNETWVRFGMLLHICSKYSR